MFTGLKPFRQKEQADALHCAHSARRFARRVVASIPPSAPPAPTAPDSSPVGSSPPLRPLRLNILREHSSGNVKTYKTLK